jgi:hypothetical protein
VVKVITLDWWLTECLSPVNNYLFSLLSKQIGRWDFIWILTGEFKMTEVDGMDAPPRNWLVRIREVLLPAP